LPDVFITSTFFSSLRSTYGPFLSERAIYYSVLLRRKLFFATFDDVFVGRFLRVTRLHAFSRFSIT
jgi:hypothetical protein